MIDQLNSHAQIGVSVVVSEQAGSNASEGDQESNKNRYAGSDQVNLVRSVAGALGRELKKLLPSLGSPARSSRFCCPLDEALVEAVVSFGESEEEEEKFVFALAPFGKFPKGGRTAIGSLKTSTVEVFFRELATSMGIGLTLKKIRGDNAHHIVESSFKAFSRALRVLLDAAKGFDLINAECTEHVKRYGRIQRKTKETTIEVEAVLDGAKSTNEVSTGIQFLDEIYRKIIESSGVCMKVKCEGDLWIDDHHSAEDVSIALGKAINQALGNKGGLNRMWTASGECGAAEVEVVMDVSNRPMIVSDVDLSGIEEKVEDLSVEMIEHVFESLVVNSQMTVHFRMIKAGSIRNLALASAIAYGRALRCCVAIDPRRAGAVSSSKGTLSV